MFRELGILIIRLTVGGLLAGHGAQKLFGWFNGPGIEGTSGWLESMGLRPGRQWAMLAGASEFGGGLLTALGFLHPIGPIAMLGSMGTAIAKAHWGKPIWVTEGGAELPVTNIAAGVGLALTIPGRFSLDRLFGIKVPKAVSIAFALGVLAATVFSFLTPSPKAQEQQDETADERQPQQEEADDQLQTARDDSNGELNPAM